MMKTLKKAVFIKILIAFVLLTSLLMCLPSMGLVKGEAVEELQQNTTLLIPSKDEIIENGYPENESGQTYGPDMGDILHESPDLLLAEGKNGTLGYIYSDQPTGAASPDELDEYYDSISDGISTPLYLHDGKTIIGEFDFDANDKDAKT